MGTIQKTREALAIRRDDSGQEVAVNSTGQFALPPEVTTVLWAMNAKINAMEQMMREMVTLTTAQEGTIKRAALARAKELCAKYGMDNALQRKVAGAIRADITKPSGVRAVRDIPRSEYKIALEQTETWEKAGLLRRMAREVITKEVSKT